MKTKIPAASRLSPAPKPITNKDITKKEAIATVSSLLYAAGLDVDQKVINRQPKGELVNVLNMAQLISRSALASSLGQSFGGKRDLYEVVGWKKNLEFSDYLIMYERGGAGIAARVVDLRAGECWRKFPVLHDGKSADDYKDETPFLKSWLELVDRLSLQSVFNELDTALGISRYSLIFIGVKGDTDYSQPLTEGGSKQIEFVKVLDEGQVTMTDFETSVYSPRYGLPNRYSCQFDKERGMAVPVHWTRVIHFKQGRGRSNVYGIPGLQKSFNALQDLEKVMGSSSEAYWQHIRQLILLIAKEGMQFAQPGTPEYNKLQEKMDDLEHNMRRVVELTNMDIKELASQVVDGKNQYELLVSVVAGAEGIPQRILIGSERGELASSQDVLNMNNSTSARQVKTCEPWLRGFVTYLYTFGFIPAPSSGKFQVEWQSLYEMTPMEKIDLGIKKAEFLNTLLGGDLERGMLIEDLIAKTLDGYVLPEADEPIEKNPVEETEGGEEESGAAPGLDEEAGKQPEEV